MNQNNSDEDMCSILKEYLQFHEKYSKIYDKMIVLMMVGQFYEIYAVINDNIQIGPNLNEISDILNIQIAKRNKKIQEIDFNNFLMAGFPDHALIKFRNILLNHNYTIILVDQITPKPNPERDVVEIISPGTILDSYNKQDTNYLLSLYISIFPSLTKKKTYSAGISLIDISTGYTCSHKIQSTFNDEKIWKDEIYRIIHFYSPIEILIHCNENELNMKKQDFINEFSLNGNNLHMNPTQSKQFLKPSYQNEFLSKIFQQTNLLTPVEYLGFERDTDLIMSFVYMIQFIYEHKIENSNEIKKPIFIENHNHLLLNHNCIYQLNLTPTHQTNHEQYNSLLSLLNKCNTAIGRRLCKERLLYPILDPLLLNERYSHIHCFQKKVNDTYLFNLCIPSLKKILDIEKLHRRMSLTILHPYEFNNLLISYEYYQKINDILLIHYKEFLNNDLLKSLQDFMYESKQLLNTNELEKWSLDKIENSLFNKNIFPEIDTLYDRINVKKQQLKCICNHLGIYIDKKKDDVVKLHFNDRYGWHLYMTQNRSKTLLTRLKNLSSNEIHFKHNGEIFLTIQKNDIRIVKKGSNYCIDLLFIEKQSDQLLSLTGKLQSLNKEKYIQCLQKFYNDYKNIFHKTIQEIGFIDLNCCISKISIENSYCCPVLTNNNDKSYFIAKDIRHPLVEKIQTDIPYIPNDVSLSEDGILLYGTNACGKSTLMKSIGLSIIMAQAGFYVPCSSFEYYPYTQLFTRILNNDNLFTGQSSFAVEMSELRSILLRANKNSLVLGDELCSGTENISAISIVSAGLKTLSDIKCSFIFTSHLHQLMNLSLIQQIQNLKIYHLKIIYDQEKDILIYDRKLENGSGPAIYGLEVCKAMDLGNEFISLARSIQLKITDQSQNLLHDKQSNYNIDIMMDKCMICKQKAEHTHHIQEQNQADENNMINHFHKNTKHNLVPLCELCHYKVHNDNLRIYGYIQTNEGIQLNYEYINEQQVIKEKKKNKKFNEKQLKIILQYKNDILDKTLKKSHCIKKLELEHHIQISSQTLTKIIQNKY